jgi:hypothetical protein
MPSGVWDPRQFLHLASLYLLFILPFFFAACCVGLAFTSRTALIDRIYFFDLLGAGLGALLVAASLFLLLPQQALIGLALLPRPSWLVAAAGRALCWQPSVRPGSRCCCSGRFEPMELGFGLNSPAGATGGGQQGGQERQSARPADGGGQPRIPFRHAPGLSLATRHVPPEQLGIHRR